MASSDQAQRYPTVQGGVSRALQAGGHLIQQILSRLPKPPFDQPCKAARRTEYQPTSFENIQAVENTEAAFDRRGNAELFASSSAPSSLAASLPTRHAHLVSKEDLGRATWTLLHTVAAEYPDKPSKRQRRDAEGLVCVSQPQRV